MTKITKKSKLTKKQRKFIKAHEQLHAIAAWNEACEAVFNAAEKEGIPTPRTAEQIFETFMDELRPVDVDELRQSYEHITNRLHPTLANRKPWPTWPVVEATDELHREFLSKKRDEALCEVKQKLYDLLDIIERS